MALFQPDYTFLCYRDVTPAFLLGEGIEVLLLDIDNTLAPYEQEDPDEKIVSWITSLKESGIRVAFVSNNHAERVERFNNTLELPVRYDAYKPLPGQPRAMRKRLGGTKKNTAMMGDQVFTDVLCGHLSGVRTILVPPILDKTDRGTRFKRWMERPILKRYYRRHPASPDIRQGSSITKEFL